METKITHDVFASLTPPTADGYSGFTVTATAGAAIAAGDICYMASTGKYVGSGAGQASTMPAVVMAVTAAAGDGSTFTAMVLGFYKKSAWNWTPGAILYASEATVGAIKNTAPATSGNRVQVVGFAVSATVVFFKPDLTTIGV
jgi:hypothetical protein